MDIRIPAIPRALLIHSVHYAEYDASDPYGEAWQAPVYLERVRLEPSDKLVQSATGGQTQAAAVLFVDAYHSRIGNPPDQPLPDFSMKSRITFGGREYFVIAPDPLFALDPTPHHWEILLE